MLQGRPGARSLRGFEMTCCFGYIWNYGELSAPCFFASSFRSLRDGLLLTAKGVVAGGRAGSRGIREKSEGGEGWEPMSYETE